MGAGQSTLYGTQSRSPVSPRRAWRTDPVMVHRTTSLPGQDLCGREITVPRPGEDLNKAVVEDDEQQEFSVSFGYHCRSYYESSDEALMTSESRLVRMQQDGSAPLSFSSPAATTHSLKALVSNPGNFSTPSSSPPALDTRRRNSSFSFLSGAALGANATLANSFLVSSSYSKAILLDMDSPKAFRQMRCPLRSHHPGVPAAGGVPQWISGSEPREKQASGQHHKKEHHQHPQPKAQKFIGIVPPHSHAHRSSGPGNSWSLSGAGYTVGSASSSSSAGSSSSMSNSAPDLMGSSFLVANDVQVAGGAAGEDRVQAVCSEENGWLFCGVYDGFNGRDAADFLAANLYENIGMHLRLLQWRSQMGEQSAPAHGDCLTSGSSQALDGSIRPSMPHLAAPRQTQSAQGLRGASGVLSVSVRQDDRVGGAKCEGPGGTGVDLSFLQPWVLCSCGSSLCECPLHQGSRLTSPPLLPTVREDDPPSVPLDLASQPSTQSYPRSVPGIPPKAQGASRSHAAGVAHPGRPVVAENGVEARDRQERHGLDGSGHKGTAESVREEDHQQHGGGVDQFQATVSAGLQRALAYTEREFFRMVEGEVEERSDLAMVGSCVLGLLIHGQHLFTLNLGDSRAVLATWNTADTAAGSEGTSTSSSSSSSSSSAGFGANSTSVKGVSISSSSSSSTNGFSEAVEIATTGRRSHDGVVRCAEGEGSSAALREGERVGGGGVEGLRAVQLTEVHCVENEVERERVAMEHPDDPSAVVGPRVKGKLRVTRAFGAGYLKSTKMNNALIGIFRVRDLWSPPYVSSEPYVRAHRLSPLDQFVVIGSDGLFDFFTNEEVVEHVARFLAVTPHGDPAKHMLEQLLVRAAEKAGKSLDELKSIPRGKRRKYHDDTTVIVITLGHTFRTSSASTLL